MTTRTTVTKKSNLKQLEANIKRLEQTDVLVGIPRSTNIRTNITGINNASLLYLHTHGSALQNIPARPVIEPAINAPDNKAMITEQLTLAAKLMLEGNYAQASNQFKTVGILAQNIVRGWFFDPRNNWAPNSPSTIAAKGSDRPLIDTGILHGSITFVVREGRQ